VKGANVGKKATEKYPGKKTTRKIIHRKKPMGNCYSIVINIF